MMEEGTRDQGGGKQEPMRPRWFFGWTMVLWRG